MQRGQALTDGVLGLSINAKPDGEVPMHGRLSIPISADDDACPEAAIELISREEKPPPAKIQIDHLWVNVLNFLDIKEATTLLFVPEIHKQLPKSLFSQSDLKKMQRFGIQNHISKLIHLIQAKELELQKQMLKIQKRWTLSQFVLIAIASGFGLWGSFKMLAEATAEDAIQTAAVDTSKTLFHQFTTECNYLTINSNYEDTSDSMYVCTFATLVVACQYTNDICADITQRMSTCDPTLWTNYTNNCDLMHAQEGDAWSMGGYIVMIISLILAGLSAARMCYRVFNYDYPPVTTPFGADFFYQILPKESFAEDYLLKQHIFKNAREEKFTLSEVCNKLDRFFTETESKKIELENDLIDKINILQNTLNSEDEPGNEPSVDLRSSYKRLSDLLDIQKKLSNCRIMHIAKLSCTLFFNPQIQTANQYEGQISSSTNISPR